MNQPSSGLSQFKDCSPKDVGQDQADEIEILGELENKMGEKFRVRLLNHGKREEGGSR